LAYKPNGNTQAVIYIKKKEHNVAIAVKNTPNQTRVDMQTAQQQQKKQGVFSMLNLHFYQNAF
jgi:hypothetical protein